MTLGENVIVPDLGKIINTTVSDMKPEETIGEKIDSGWADLGRSAMWESVLKPYLKDRISSLREMLEINLTGNETVAEVGVRFLICNAVAGELQFLIDRTEQTRQLLDKKRAETKKKAEDKLIKTIEKNNVRKEK